MNENKEQVTLWILTLKEIFSRFVSIPSYQRSYRWSAEKNVKQLLDDIIRELRAPEYRIGSVILHQTSNNSYEVVDGQQRLITLTLILLNLKYKEQLPLASQEFTHLVSRENIYKNYLYINKYLEVVGCDKQELSQFISTQCTFNVITVTELGDAFQLFDSQNTRGKELDAADLLKAYHLRSMSKCNESEKLTCVKRWEEAVNKGKLNSLLSDLFRIRSWINKKNRYDFTKDQIAEFKGVNLVEMLARQKCYPYIFSMYNIALCKYFQIDESIANGIRFFDYIDHFLNLYEDINFYKDKGWKNNHNPLIAHWRLIDQRIESFYKNVLFYYQSKFGEDDNFEQFADILFRMCFVYTLINRTMLGSGVVNQLVNGNLQIFQIIKSWYEPDITQLRERLEFPDKKFDYAKRFDKSVTSTSEWNRFCDSLKRVKENE